LSPVFKNDEHNAEQIDSQSMYIFGLLHCEGSPKEKAVAFYNILQDGGL
jgi:hypothetical protein